ncbi:DNA-directed RNA polymerase II subunit RPB9 [Drechslerella dactyloides]|uniref:DNA-directed RNA polymerase II subunit RPB9 n=1 Tax=Drechslerella dactyloides TaxID=74499 RepID=A0AAD6NLQ0_DREDA|nr:DNA-directed RNA polymerase II subunit RPB9 [Drechslerella dactyloides]
MTDTRGSAYSRSTLAPSVSSVFFIFSASSFVRPSFSIFGAASTNFFESTSERPRRAFTSLMILGLAAASKEASLTLKRVFSSAAASSSTGAAAAAAGAAEGAAAGAARRASGMFRRSYNDVTVSSSVSVEIWSTICTSFGFAGALVVVVDSHRRCGRQVLWTGRTVRAAAARTSERRMRGAADMAMAIGASSDRELHSTPATMEEDGAALQNPREREASEKITFRFCRECSNMLYPREDRENGRLLFACRNCNFIEEATSQCVFRNVLSSVAEETAGVTTDVGSDPTLPRSNRTCPVCGESEAVFFQSQQRKEDTKMASNIVVRLDCNTTIKLTADQYFHSPHFDKDLRDCRRRPRPAGDSSDDASGNYTDGGEAILAGENIYRNLLRRKREITARRAARPEFEAHAFLLLDTLDGRPLLARRNHQLVHRAFAPAPLVDIREEDIDAVFGRVVRQEDRKVAEAVVEEDGGVGNFSRRSFTPSSKLDTQNSPPPTPRPDD